MGLAVVPGGRVGTKKETGLVERSRLLPPPTGLPMGRKPLLLLLLLALGLLANWVGLVEASSRECCRRMSGKGMSREACRAIRGLELTTAAVEETKSNEF